VSKDKISIGTSIRTGRPLTVLVLSGTTEAYALASALGGLSNFRVISSFAGRTANPRLPRGETRIGGFGGSRGLAAYLADNGIAAVVDATHPFAAQLPWHATEACRMADIPLLHLGRPPWQAAPGDDWMEVDDWSAAAVLVARHARRVLMAIGRLELEPFSHIADTWFLIRSVEAPSPMPAFSRAEMLLARGPFDLESERELLSRNRIDTIVCKNSGGDATRAKLDAARELGIRVIMKRRPPRPAVPTVSTIDEAVAWIQALGSR